MDLNYLLRIKTAKNVLSFIRLSNGYFLIFYFPKTVIIFFSLLFPSSFVNIYKVEVKNFFRMKF